jgi:hypothetical protein
MIDLFYNWKACFIIVFCAEVNAASLVYSEDFENQSIDDWTRLDNTTISRDVSRSGSYSVKAVHSGTVVFRKTFQDSEEFYTEWWWYTSPNWTEKNGVKFLRINYHRSTGVNAWWSNGSWSQQISTYAYSNTDAENPARQAPRFSGIEPVKGGWIKLAVYARTNTGGDANGIFRIWMKDGDFDPNIEPPAYDSTNFIWNNQGSTTFGSIDIISNIEDSDANCITYVDDVEIWDGMPASLQPPSPPILLQ